MNRPRLARLVVAVLVFASCGGDEHTGRRDPLPEGSRPEDVFIMHTQAVDGVSPAEPDGQPPIFALSLGETCLVANVGLAFGNCMTPRPGQSAAMYDGGVHGDVSLAWLVAGDTDVAMARFWQLDGTTVDQEPILADGWDDPPVVFGLAVAATNEIVGIELLDADGHVVLALPIDPEA